MSELHLTVILVEKTEARAILWSDNEKQREAAADSLDAALRVAEATSWAQGLDQHYEELVSLGVPEVSVTGYDNGRTWQAFWKHPQNSGMASSVRAKTAKGALVKAVTEERKRQQRASLSAAKHGIDGALRALERLLR